MRTRDMKALAEEKLEEYDDAMISLLIDSMKDELGSKNLITILCEEEFAGKTVDDIDENLVKQILEESKATDEDKEIFLDVLEMWAPEDAWHWAYDEVADEIASQEDYLYDQYRDDLIDSGEAL